MGFDEKEDLDKIEKLLKILKTSGVTEFFWEKDDEKVDLSFNSPAPTFIASSHQDHGHHGMPSFSPNQQQQQHYNQQQSQGFPSAPESGASPKATEPKIDKKLVEVKSPFVGTFYRRPSPDADAYVDVGDKISKGTVLCIVEAMKLMNEIESEIDGVIEEILAKDSQPVEYGEILYRIRVL